MKLLTKNTQKMSTKCIPQRKQIADPWQFEEYLDKSVSESFFITTVTEDEIERELTKINPNKSYRFDNLHP